MSPEEQNIREQIAAGNMDHQPSGDTAKHLCLVIDSLRLQLTEARKDSDRLQFLIENYGIMIWASVSRDFIKPPIGAMSHREIIDAARASQHSGEGKTLGAAPERGMKDL